jgi:hypothetical protein
MTPGKDPAARRAAPGSVRHSVTLLAAVALSAVVLPAVTDGLVAAAMGLAVFTAIGLAVARYAVGGGAHDGGYRRPVRLLGSREPALDDWEWMVHNALGSEGDAYFARRLRPQLQRLFAARLAARQGTDLYRAPLRARALIGLPLWPWIDPSQPPPEPSIPESVLRALLDRLEALDTSAGRSTPAERSATDSAATAPDQAQ